MGVNGPVPLTVTEHKYPPPLPGVYLCPCSFHLKVTRETELNFEYEVRTRAQRRAMGIPDNGFVSSPSVRPLPFPAPEIPTAEATVTTAAAPGAGPTASKEVNLQSEKTKCGGAKLNIKQESGKHATTAEKKGSNDEKAPTAPAAAEVSATPAQAFLPFQV